MNPLHAQGLAEGRRADGTAVYVPPPRSRPRVTAIELPHLTGYWKRRAAFRRQHEANAARLRAYLAEQAAAIAECQTSNIRP